MTPCTCHISPLVYCDDVLGPEDAIGTLNCMDESVFVCGASARTPSGPDVVDIVVGTSVHIGGWVMDEWCNGMPEGVDIHVEAS